MSRKILLIPVILQLLFAPVLFASACPCPEETREVRYVIDGDTVILKNEQRVRLIGIDAPEISHRKYGKKGEAWGDEAKEYLASLIQRKEITLKPGKEEFDRFGRRLAYLYLPDGTFVNRKMVEEGYSEAYRKFPFEYKADFIEVEKIAREGKKGMWGQKQNSWLEAFMEILE